MHVTDENTSGPLVSVLLPVYNGAAYLAQAIDAALAQSYRNFELIVINDGSKDDSEAIISGYQDPRLRAYHQENQGLAATLNRAIGLARGKYLARQDQDDVSLPSRLDKQVAFLEAHPACGLVGSWAEIWRDNTPTGRIHKHPSENLALKFELLFDNPFVHSSVLIRRSALDRVGLYSTDPSRQPPEDYELWSRIARHFEVANIPEVLLIYREVLGSMSRDGASPFLERSIKLSAENLAWATGRDPSDPAVLNLAALSKGAYHRVSCNPSFRELAAILSRAANDLSNSQSVRPDVLQDRLQSRLTSVRYHLLQYKSGGLLGWIGAGRLAKVLRRVFAFAKRVSARIRLI